MATKCEIHPLILLITSISLIIDKHGKTGKYSPNGRIDRIFKACHRFESVWLNQKNPPGSFIDLHTDDREPCSKDPAGTPGTGEAAWRREKPPPKANWLKPNLWVRFYPVRLKFIGLASYWFICKHLMDYRNHTRASTYGLEMKKDRKNQLGVLSLVRIRVFSLVLSYFGTLILCRRKYQGGVLRPRQ